MMRSGAFPTHAAVARKIGVTRARVTQLLTLLRLCNEAKDVFLGLGDSLSRPIVTERFLRFLVRFTQLTDSTYPEDYQY